MAGKSRKKATQRRVVVLSSLVTMLSATSALMIALAPAPLRPEPLLIGLESQGNNLGDALFKTQVPAEQTPWKYIYIHQSKTVSGDTSRLSASGDPGDHFLIGNGAGLVDGEIQMTQRWNLQKSPLPPNGVAQLNPQVISVCVVGDFDLSRPSAAQFRRLTELTRTLQARYRVAPENVMLYSQPATMAGIGEQFPLTSFREQLLP